MNEEDLVTIIIPCHKTEKTIKKAVDSILCQSYSNYEIIIVENGYKDATEKILKEIGDKRIRYYYLSEGNVSIARNFGISKAKGDYIYFMDADDTVHADLLEKCLRASKRQNADVVIFNFNKVSEKQTIKIELPWRNQMLSSQCRKEKLIPMLISTEKNEQAIMATVWRIFSRSDIIRKLHFEPNVTIAEDLLFCVQLFNQANRVYVLKDVLYDYVLSSASSLNSPKLDSINISIKYHEVLKRILAEEGLYSKDMEKRFYKNQGRMYTCAVSSCARCKNKKKAIDGIRRIGDVYRTDKYNYYRLNLPIYAKITYILLCFRQYSLLYTIYRLKEKRRLRNYN